MEQQQQQHEQSTEGESPMEHHDEEEVVYGGCEGPDAVYINLVSSDDHVFTIKKSHAIVSGTIQAMLTGPGEFMENETNVIHFKEISSHILFKACTYFAYKVLFTNSPDEIPEFKIEPEIALDLLMAANFLDC